MKFQKTKNFYSILINTKNNSIAFKNKIPDIWVIKIDRFSKLPRISLSFCYTFQQLIFELTCSRRAVQ